MALLLVGRRRRRKSRAKNNAELSDFDQMSSTPNFYYSMDNELEKIDRDRASATGAHVNCDTPEPQADQLRQLPSTSTNDDAHIHNAGDLYHHHRIGR